MSRPKRFRIPLPAHIDLVEWLKLHGHAQTSGEARKMLEQGRVRSGANPVGRMQIKIKRGTLESVEYVASPVVPATLRDTLHVQK